MFEQIMSAIRFIFYLVSCGITITDKTKYWFTEAKYHLISDLGGFVSLVSGHFNRKKITEYPDRKGIVAIVTGGGRGIGQFVVKGLVRCGMHVIVAVRNPEKCQQFEKELKDLNYEGTFEFLQLDVSSMKSVKSFADVVCKKYPAIHILVNNAGILNQGFSLTEDGFESHLATNYIGHFYLTHLLMKNLTEGGNKCGRCARIVNVSSCAHIMTNIFYDDINLQKEYHDLASYGQSKLAQIMFSRYLNRCFIAWFLPIRSYACHPGVVNTDMLIKMKNNPLLFMTKTPEEGAANVIYPCIAAELESKGGHYLYDFTEGQSTSFSKDEKEQRKLFDLTCKMLNIDFFGNVKKPLP